RLIADSGSIGMDKRRHIKAAPEQSGGKPPHYKPWVDKASRRNNLRRLRRTFVRLQGAQSGA
ncbi:MAG: hypothetical protein CO182_01150, partial [Lysobacterales bacterium CG_4_9_14_3_um_filter_62_6]